MTDAGPTVLILAGALMVSLAAVGDAVLASASRASLRDLSGKGSWRDEAVDRLLGQPHRTWATLVVLEAGGLVVAGIGAGALISRFSDDRFGGGPDVVLAHVVLTLVAALLIVGGPYLGVRLLTGRDPDMWSLVAARPLWIAGTLFAPFVWPIARLARERNGDLAFGSPIARADEVRALVDSGEEEGLFEEDEREMIVGIFRLSDTKVREVMVPRIDIVAIPDDAELDEALDAILTAGHSRIPVYSETLDNIKGLLYAKDLLKAFRARDFAPVLTLSLREPYFVPESKPVDELMAELQSRKVHMAIVVDEYGGTAGLVTIEDLLEEIVGEIQDEYDTEEARFEMISEDEGVFQAGVDIDDVNRLMDVDLPTEDVDTLAGLVMTGLGRVPEVGDWAEFQKARIEVQAVTGRRIKRVRVLRRAPDSTPDEAPSPGTEDGHTD